jgi:hypothetical protein
LHYFLFDKVVGALYYKGSHDLLYPDPDVILPEIWDPVKFSTRPVNVTINHDGKTALANCVGSDLIPVMQILSPGVVKLREIIYSSEYRLDPRYFNGQSNQLGVHTQSTAFTWTSNKAYVSLQITDAAKTGVGYARNEISELRVVGPGKVVPTGVLIPVGPPRGTSQLFGVDVLAIEPGNHFLYFGNPTVSGGQTLVSVVDLWKKLQKCNLFLQPGEVSSGVSFRVQ